MSVKSRNRKPIFRPGFKTSPDPLFVFFMEEFMTTLSNGNEIEIENKGFEKWKTMSKEERSPFSFRADQVNSAYLKLLRKEESEMQWVDDEADSAEVGKFDENYDNYYDSDELGITRSDTHSSFYSEDSFCAGTWDWLTRKVA